MNFAQFTMFIIAGFVLLGPLFNKLTNYSSKGWYNSATRTYENPKLLIQFAKEERINLSKVIGIGIFVIFIFWSL